MQRAHSPRLILASSSTYRKALLARLPLTFEIALPHVDESVLPGEAPEHTALRLAEAKAEAVAARNPDALVIGSDQVATLDGEHIGKPGDHPRALAQLKKMRGQEVVFHTAVCLLDTRSGSSLRTQTQNVSTLVRFRHLPDAELDAYLRIDQPYDCAGSAKNETLGIALLEYLRSDDPTALTGLPLIALTTMLRRAGVALFESSGQQ